MHLHLRILLLRDNLTLLIIGVAQVLKWNAFVFCFLRIPLRLVYSTCSVSSLGVAQNLLLLFFLIGQPLDLS